MGVGCGGGVGRRGVEGGWGGGRGGGEGEGWGWGEGGEGVCRVGKGGISWLKGYTNIRSTHTLTPQFIPVHPTAFIMFLIWLLLLIAVARVRSEICSEDEIRLHIEKITGRDVLFVRKSEEDDSCVL